jgi:hypothetical protein
MAIVAFQRPGELRVATSTLLLTQQIGDATLARNKYDGVVIDSSADLSLIV